MYATGPSKVRRRAETGDGAHADRMMVYTVENYTNGKKLVPGYRSPARQNCRNPRAAGYTNPLTITSFVGFCRRGSADRRAGETERTEEIALGEQVVLPVFGEVARDAVQILRISPNSEKP